MDTGEATKKIGQLYNLNTDRRAMDNYLLLYKYIFVMFAILQAALLPLPPIYVKVR